MSSAWQVPPQQTWPVMHAWPHEPQLASSVIVSWHAIVPGAPQQAWTGESAVQSTGQPVHWGADAARQPPQHIGVAPLHVLPHPMQFARSESGSTHMLLQQSWPPLHAWPHAPQLFASLVVLAHAELQHVLAEGPHVIVHEPHAISSELSSTQTPLQHDVPAPHAWPHIPQFESLDERSKPSSVDPSQSSS